MRSENTGDQAIPVFIRRRMPNAIEEELLTATEYVRRYLAIAWRVFERAEREKQTGDSHESDTNDTIRLAENYFG